MKFSSIFLAAGASSMALNTFPQHHARGSSSYSLVKPPPSLAQTVKTSYIDVNGTRLAYRRFGKSNGSPIVYFNHLRGAMDVTDPLLFNYIAQYREVILFDNIGVGHSGGNLSSSVEAMGEYGVGLIKGLGIEKFVPLGFSLGGLVAQHVSWQYPDMIEKVVLAGTQSGNGPGVAATDASVMEVAARDGEPTEDDMLFLFFSNTTTSRSAGHDWFQRRVDRRVEGESLSGSVSSAGGQVQLAASFAFANVTTYFARLQDIKVPVLVTNGHTDVMIPTVNSFVLQQELPYGYLHIYPDSGHGHLFQFPKQYAEALKEFLELE